jgi:hypothetical protein
MGGPGGPAADPRSLPCRSDHSDDNAGKAKRPPARRQHDGCGHGCPGPRSRLRERGLRFTTLSIGGTPTLAFGFLARAIAALDPSVVVLLVSPYSVRSRGFYAQTFTYDACVVPDLFTAREVLAETSFHLEGLAEQAAHAVPPPAGHTASDAVRWAAGPGATWARTDRRGIRQSMGRGPLLLWSVRRAGGLRTRTHARDRSLARRLRRRDRGSS